jgi:hypothetical protein
MKTIFLDREMEKLDKLNKGEYKLNASGLAKLKEFKEIKRALNLASINNQRELLIGWEEYEQKWDFGEYEDRSDLIDEYLANL